MEKKVYNIFEFEITNIVCEKILFKNSSQKIKNDLNKTTDANIICDIKVDQRAKSQIVLLGIELNEKESKDKIIEIHYSFHFNLKENKNYDKALINKIDDKLGANLLAVSYSTFRGICFKEFKNSIYSSISPLPIIDTSILYKTMNKGKEEKNN